MLTTQFHSLLDHCIMVPSLLYVIQDRLNVSLPITFLKMLIRYFCLTVDSLQQEDALKKKNLELLDLIDSYLKRYFIWSATHVYCQQKIDQDDNLFMYLCSRSMIYMACFLAATCYWLVRQ